MRRNTPFTSHMRHLADIGPSPLWDEIPKTTATILLVPAPEVKVRAREMQRRQKCGKTLECLQCLQRVRRAPELRGFAAARASLGAGVASAGQTATPPSRQGEKAAGGTLAAARGAPPPLRNGRVGRGQTTRPPGPRPSRDGCRAAEH